METVDETTITDEDADEADELAVGCSVPVLEPTDLLDSDATEEPGAPELVSAGPVHGGGGGVGQVVMVL